MHYTGASFQSSTIGKKIIPAPVLLPGSIVTNSDTSDNVDGVQEYPDYCYILTWPRSVLSKGILGINCRHPWGNFVPDCVMSLITLVMRSAPNHTSVPAPYNGGRGRKRTLSCFVHRWKTRLDAQHLYSVHGSVSM